MAADSLPADQHQPAPPGVYRLLVVGGGLAGTAAARESARRGVRVALVWPAPERAEPVGSTPLGGQIRLLQAPGGQAGPEEPPERSGIDLYAGQAVFCHPHAVAVGGRELRFRKALLAVGTKPLLPAIDGADQDACLRVETLSRLSELPGRLAVVGCGPEACQWAQAFRRFGSQVHLIARQETILPEEEPEAAGLLRARLEQEGVRLHLGCQELVVETTGKVQAIVIGREGRREKLLVNRILVCGPRQPDLSGLRLESAGVAYGAQGVVVGDRLQTTNRHVFAAGAACGVGFETPQAAEATARLAVHNALSFTSLRLSRLVIPRCICTDPSIVRVGLTPPEAASRQIEIETYRADLVEEEQEEGARGSSSAPDEANRPDHRQGLIVVHVQRRSGRIVGATVAAEAAGELIAPLLLLMTRGWPLGTLADVIACRASRFESLVRLAKQHQQGRPLARGARLVQWWRVRRQGAVLW